MIGVSVVPCCSSTSRRVWWPTRWWCRVGDVVPGRPGHGLHGRLREHGRDLTPALAIEYAKLAAIGLGELGTRVLPVLKTVGVADFAIQDRKLTWIEEYVGLSAPVVAQTFAVLEALGPGPVRRWQQPVET